VARFVNSEDQLPDADDLAQQTKGNCRMENDQNALRSGSVAAIFFTTVSSATAIAIALLPFVASH
jgi:hypothetical protein